MSTEHGALERGISVRRGPFWCWTKGETSRPNYLDPTRLETLLSNRLGLRNYGHAWANPRTHLLVHCDIRIHANLEGQRDREWY